jgi:hypothetical protein
MYGIVFTVFRWANVGLPDHLTHCLRVIVCCEWNDLSAMS